MSLTVEATEIFQATVIQADTLRVGFRAPFAGNFATIKIWEGLSVPYDNIESYIFEMSVGNQLESTGTDLQCPGKNFLDGFYTIGYCANESSSSVCATVSVVDGQPAQQCATYLYLVAQYADKLDVFFSTLPGNNPQANTDIIVVVEAALSSQIMNTEAKLFFQIVAAEAEAGIVELPFPGAGIMQTGNTYTLYYAPRGIIEACAGYQFELFA